MEWRPDLRGRATDLRNGAEHTTQRDTKQNLTGDLVHFKYMWDNKIVPPFNFNQEQSLNSIERVVKLVAEHKAQLWIGHDKDITARINRAPKFYE